MNITETFQGAKEELLIDGKYAPRMFVEYRADGKESLEMYYFADFGAETQTQENMQIFGLGVKFAEKNKRVGIEFTQITFISEAWMVVATPEERKKWKRPENAPNRREYLTAMVVEVEGKTIKPHMYRAQMLRAGKSLDLGPEEKREVPRMIFPMYFLSGYSSAQMTPEQLTQLLKDKLRF